MDLLTSDPLLAGVRRETARLFRKRIERHPKVAQVKFLFRRLLPERLECHVVILPHEGKPRLCGAAWTDAELIHGDTAIVERRLGLIVETELAEL